MSDDDDDGPRERSASYAGSRSLELLGTLRSAKHAGRLKALKKFQEYVNKYKPEFYDDDIELLLVVRGWIMSHFLRRVLPVDTLCSSVIISPFSLSGLTIIRRVDPLVWLSISDQRRGCAQDDIKKCPTIGPLAGVPKTF